MKSNSVRKIQPPRLRGSAMVFVLVISSVAAIVLSGLVTFVVSNVKYSLEAAKREEALQIAESGAHFYRWYIAHKLDGKNTEQMNEFWQLSSPRPYGVDTPYEADFLGIGRYRIVVTPPASHSTVFTLESTGWTYASPEATRTVRVRLRRPSWSEYMILGNDTFRLSNRTEIFGPMHGNEGVRFDGVAHNSTSSGVTCYNDPDTPGGGACERPGVWSGEWPGSEPYNTLLSNPVFLGGRNFPIPKIDFNSVTADLAYMKSEAQTSGEAAHYYGPSGAGYRGYRIEFKPTGYEITKVKTVDDKDSVTRVDTPSRISRSFPSKGLIFVEDNVWFNGKGVAGVKVETERMTIAVADLLGGSDPNIYIEDGAQYKNGGSGQEALGFIAEGSIGFPGDCQNTLTLHGALLAQKGAVQRAHYGSAYNKNKITIFGAIASKGRIGFGYTDGTGFQNRELLFDANLTVSPPPYFPTGTQYSIDLWEEL